ncbi:hypothetical protein KKA47_05665, partial [bacterium]|nr:hypothetical protein [bacterium]
MSVTQCGNDINSFEDIVARFECIGRESGNSAEALHETVVFQSELADLFQIDNMQASLFAARILDYVPKQGSTAAQLHEDLAQEMEDVVLDPQCRKIKNDVTPTDIVGIDRLRQMAAGAYEVGSYKIMDSDTMFFPHDFP